MKAVHFPPPRKSDDRDSYCVSVSRLKRLQAHFPDVQVPSVVAALAVEYQRKPADEIPPTGPAYWRAIVDRLKTFAKDA